MPRPAPSTARPGADRDGAILRRARGCRAAQRARQTDRRARAARRSIPTSGFVVITSRCSFEMVGQDRGVRRGDAGLGFGADLARARARADECGLTLIAIARADQATIFPAPRAAQAEGCGVSGGENRQAGADGQPDRRLLRDDARAGGGRRRSDASQALLDAENDSRNRRLRRDSGRAGLNAIAAGAVAALKRDGAG